MFERLQSIPKWFVEIKWKFDFLTSKIDFRNFWGHFWVIWSIMKSVKAALPQCKGLKKTKKFLFNVFGKLQSILEWFVEMKLKFDFLTSKIDFRNFWGHFWLILTSKAEKTLKLGYFVGLKMFFETLNQESTPKDFSEMFSRLFWYVSRRRRTKIGLGIR